MEKWCEVCQKEYPASGPNSKCPDRLKHPKPERRLVTVIHVYSDGTTETLKVEKS